MWKACDWSTDLSLLPVLVSVGVPLKMTLFEDGVSMVPGHKASSYSGVLGHCFGVVNVAEGNAAKELPTLKNSELLLDDLGTASAAALSRIDALSQPDSVLSIDAPCIAEKAFLFL